MTVILICNDNHLRYVNNFNVFKLMEALLALINQKIADFSATAFKNGEIIDINNEDIAGKWAIFFFYPADFTFVCPTELGDLADYHEELQGMGVEIYSVSTDTHFVLVVVNLSSDQH